MSTPNSSGSWFVRELLRRKPSRVESSNRLDFEKCEARNLLSASNSIDLGSSAVNESFDQQYVLGQLNVSENTAYLQQGASDLALVAVEQGTSARIHVYQQLMDDLPVHGSYVMVSQDTNGRVIDVQDGATRLLATEDGMTPQMDLIAATQIAEQEFDRFTATSSGELVWFQAGDRSELAWRINTVVPNANTLGSDLEFMTVVDANSGAKLSQVQSPDVIGGLVSKSDQGVFPRITINDGIGGAGSREYAAPFDPVVELNGCTGTLIAENVVISARHCGIGAGNQVFFGDNSNSPDAVFTVQSSQLPDGNGSLLDGGDVVILTLTSNVPSSVAEPMRFIDATNELEGMTSALIGYGYNGLGSSGHGFSADGFRWGGENIIDAYGSPADASGANIISTDFDDGSNGNNTIPSGSSVPLEFEATTAPGDSGGPVLVQQGGEWLIAGVLSGGTTSTSVYGDISWWTGTAIYRSEIEAAGGVFAGTGLGRVSFDKPSYEIGETAAIAVTDSNGIDPVSVTLTSDLGDTETLVLIDAGGGVYTGDIATAEGAAVPGDGVLQTADGEQITVTYIDPDDGTGESATVEDTANIFIPSEGVLVGIDFADSGNAAPTNWTSVSDGGNTTLSDLVDEDGNPTAIDLAIAELADGTWDGYPVTPIASTIPQNSNDLSNLDGQIYTGADALRLTFQDLNPGSDYEIFVMSAEGFYASIEQDVTIAGAGDPITFNQDFNQDELFINDQIGDSTRTFDEYALIVEANGSGEIVIDIAPDGATSDVVLAGLAIREVPVLDLLDPLGKKLLDGVEDSGSLADTQLSDDVYYTLLPSPTTNPIKQKIDVVLISEYSGGLNNFDFYVEAGMTGGPEGDVLQTIRLLNHQLGQWEIVDTRIVTNTDSQVVYEATGDISRFVKAGTGEVIASLQWLSPEFSGAPFSWSINIDQAGWLIT